MFVKSSHNLRSAGDDAVHETFASHTQRGVYNPPLGAVYLPRSPFRRPPTRCCSPWITTSRSREMYRRVKETVTGSQLMTSWCVSVQENATSLLWPAGVADPVSPPQGDVHMQKQPASGFIIVDKFSSLSERRFPCVVSPGCSRLMRQT